MNDPRAVPLQGPERRAQLHDALGRVRADLAQAAVAAGRDASEVTLVAVTKTFPASDVRTLAALGVTDVGENRDQEARPKWDACRDLSLRWHFVGQLQTNKAASVARYADVVHSVDRPRLVGALDRGAASAGRIVRVLVQVDLGDPGSVDGLSSASRGGVAPAEVGALAALVTASPNLVLGGVMGVATVDGDPDRDYAILARAAAEVRAHDPAADWISAGMSGDFRGAIRNGATHVRLGSSLLGNRPPLR